MPSPTYSGGAEQEILNWMINSAALPGWKLQTKILSISTLEPYLPSIKQNRPIECCCRVEADQMIRATRKHESIKQNNGLVRWWDTCHQRSGSQPAHLKFCFLGPVRNWHIYEVGGEAWKYAILTNNWVDSDVGGKQHIILEQPGLSKPADRLPILGRDDTWRTVTSLWNLRVFVSIRL